MSQAPAPPPPAPGKPGTRRWTLPWLSEKPETRSIQIAALATIVVHLVLLMLAPRLLDLTSVPGGAHPAPKPLDLDLSQMFLPPPPKPVAKPPPMKFVETNPNAPENTPDKTNNFSDRNQQVAQEKPTPKGKSDAPAITGRKDVESNQIVTGQLSKPQESVPVSAPVPSVPKPPSTAAPKREQDPLPGFEKMQGPSPDGFATTNSKSSENPKPIPQIIDGAKDAPLLDNSTATTPQIDPKHPQPRRVLNQNVRPAIFKQNDFGTSNMGLVAYDAHWSNYGVYLRKLIDTVQIEWDNILDGSRIYPNPGSTVSVKFVLDSKGDVTQVVHVEPSAGTSDAASHACVSAITTRAPYGPWTDDMIAVLGTETTMTFTFYYQ